MTTNAIAATDRSRSTRPQKLVSNSTDATATSSRATRPRSSSSLASASGMMNLSHSPGETNRSPWSTLFGPTAQQAAHHDQLAEVVGVVVGDQECLPQDRLPVPVRDPGQQVGRRAADQRT